MADYRVAVLGATGLVGQTIIKVLEERRFPIASVKLLASDHPAGKKLFVNHNEIEIEEVNSGSFSDVDIAFFSAGADASRRFSPVAAETGAAVIDDSSAFRMEEDVPLVVPEVNLDDLDQHNGIVASPNCLATQMVVALYPLHRVNPIKRVTAATYQAISGTGASAIEELTAQTRQVLEGQSSVPHVYPHRIAFNVLPEIDVFLDNGYTREEWKVIEETKRIMHAEDIFVSVTCVRVPVFVGHSEALHIEFAKPMSSDIARNILSRAPGIRVLDDPGISLYPQPTFAAGTDEVLVGRIRQDISSPNGLVMWVVADNLRKGSASNAVQIAEALINRQLVHGRR